MYSWLTRQAVETILEELEAGCSSDYCLTCECLHGLLTQLEIDAAEEISDLTGKFKVEKGEIHKCHDCNPCPPGAMYADYIKENMSK